jgi:hypothetical protein
MLNTLLVGRLVFTPRIEDGEVVLESRERGV